MKSNPKDILKEFKIKQRDFERKLEVNTNTDLALWHQHIVWIWEHSEIVDKDQRHLISLIEKCIEKFAGDCKYKNDIRFYNIFYKYTQITSDPDDVYDSINSLSLFDKLSKFYISWSWVLANLMKDEKALDVLNLGIEKKAEPICLLIQAKEELETKMKEKKLYTTNTEILNEMTTNIQSIQSTQKTQALRERKRLSIEPSSTMISLANRISLSNKQSLKESTTPKENLLIKSSGNRQGFEILEEEEIDRQSSSNDQVNTTITVKKIEENKNHQNSKVKQNLIEKLKPLDDHTWKEPKIVIHETLKPNQKFYSDLRRIYADNTEYSFEEIRMRKMKKMAAKKQRSKESQPNSELVKEIEMLKAKVKENEQREKEKESLQNQVDMLKKQIEMIIASSITTQSSKRYFDEVDGDVDKTKKLKLSENKQIVRNKLREITKKEPEKELTIVRDMWNGTFASQYNSPAHFNQNQSEFNSNTNKDQQNTNRKEQFSIFKDPTSNNLTRTDFSYYPQMCTTAAQDCFTIALPHDPSEFNAKLSSTPAMNRRRT